MEKKPKKEAVIVPKGAKRCQDCNLVRVEEEFKEDSEICKTCIRTRKTVLTETIKPELKLSKETVIEMNPLKGFVGKEAITLVLDKNKYLRVIYLNGVVIYVKTRD